MKAKNWNKYIAANALLLIFIGITLMKPIHLLVDNHSFKSHSEQQNHKSHDNCTICQFTLDASTEAENSSSDLFFGDLIGEIQIYNNKPVHNFALVLHSPRAPPVCFS